MPGFVSYQAYLNLQASQLAGASEIQDYLLTLRLLG